MKMQRVIAHPYLTVPDKLSGTAGWQSALPGIYLRDYPDEGTSVVFFGGGSVRNSLCRTLPPA